MGQETNYIVYLCYGNEGTLHECAFSLLSLSRLYSSSELSGTEIWIYTDNPGFFQSFKDGTLPLHYRAIDKQIIQQWRGSIDFTHRVKIELLKDLLKDKTGNILYLDSDTVFTHRADKVMQDIQAKKLYMHVMEGIVSDCRNPVMTKLNNYLQKNDSLKINEKPLYDLAMWNAGVLGFHTAYTHLLDKVLSFTDTEYTRFRKHVVEQFAFSVFMQEAGPVKTAAPYILHYWNLKEARTVLASFFSHFKNASWDELTRYSLLIQMHVLMQEKVNFLHNRGYLQKLQKKQWQPVIPDWNEAVKQL